jgi:hypothetical protein
LVEKFESRFFKILKLKSIEKFEFHRSSDGFSLSLRECLNALKLIVSG